MHCRFNREAHQQQCLVLLVHGWRSCKVRPRWRLARALLAVLRRYSAKDDLLCMARAATERNTDTF